MRKLRTKLILIFLGVVLLPLIPLAMLVNNLVHHSYSIGVNPQVERALNQGLEFSRELYNHKKELLVKALSDTLSMLSPEALVKAAASGEASAQPLENGWTYRMLHLYDSGGRLLAPDTSLIAPPAAILSPSLLFQMASNKQSERLISDRTTNNFVAVQEWTANRKTYFAALSATLDTSFLSKTDNSLRMYQRYLAMSISPVSIPRSFWYTYLFISLCILAVVAAIAIWISRRMTSPLEALVSGTREIGLGNLDFKIEQTSNDEFADLVAGFNRMTTDLKQSQERLVHLERMAAWREIARRLAHEIKNPLTPIQLTVQEMVDQCSGGDDEYQKLISECHSIISEEIENLRRLVSEFSAFGRMPELTLRETDINQLIGEICKLYPHRLIHRSLAENLPGLSVDEDRIRRVMINLIENAWQASEKNGEIHIRTFRDEDRVVVEVEDEGSGISVELAEKIFQPYFSTRSKGIGLGLAITRQMIEEHHGEISMISEPGAGAVFRFTLPITVKSVNPNPQQEV